MFCTESASALKGSVTSATSWNPFDVDFASAESSESVALGVAFEAMGEAETSEDTARARSRLIWANMMGKASVYDKGAV